MNNTDFRRLVSDTPRREQDGSSNGQSNPSATPMSLGSRNRASIPMTPRTVKGAPHLDFARQLAERNNASQPARKFRSLAAPKGSKLASGYTDRVRDRNEDAEKDGREARIQALEEQMKLGQIEREVFESLRDEITGGDIRATHLVKGLDRRLLERVKRGEDVLSAESSTADTSTDAKPTSPPPDADEELEKLEAAPIAPVEHEKAEKRGEMAPPPKPLAGTKRSRNDILAELKASREAAKAASQPQLGSRFRRVGETNKLGSRIKRDEKGREVLITVDEDGRVKRKVRKTAGEERRDKERTSSAALLMPEPGSAPLGMVVPVTPLVLEPSEEEEEDDIFANVGAEYNPLGDDAEVDDASSSDEDEDIPTTKPTSSNPHAVDDAPTPDSDEAAPSPTTAAPESPPPARKQNYFNTPTTSTTPSMTPINPLSDPTILATLHRAAALAPTPETPAPPQHRLLASMQHDRDMEDMDLGFGSSRFDDAEEGDEAGGRVKLSQWRGGKGFGDEDEEGEEGGGGKGKEKGKERKRGGKKRKGDKDSVADVLSVLEGRKAKGK